MRKIFTFTEPNMTEAQEGFKEVMVQKEDVGRLVGHLEVRRNGSRWTLRKCKDQLIQPILEVITSSIEEGRVPQEWKRANIVPIYKNGKKIDPLNCTPVTNKSCQQNLRDIN